MRFKNRGPAPNPEEGHEYRGRGGREAGPGDAVPETGTADGEVKSRKKKNRQF